MTAQATSSTPQFVADLLSAVQVTSVGHNRFTATTGQKSDGGRRVVEGSRVLAQAITAVAQRFGDKSVRSAHAVFARVVLAGPPIDLVVCRSNSLVI